jgi:hypothetical protein
MREKMKYKYETPTVELLKVRTEDIITLSTETEGTGVTDNWDDLVD